MNTETGIAKAVRLAGSQTALAKKVGVTPQAVQKWVTQGVVPADRCRDVKDALDGQVSWSELNPKVFGEESPPPPLGDDDGEHVDLGRRLAA